MKGTIISAALEIWAKDHHSSQLNETKVELRAETSVKKVCRGKNEEIKHTPSGPAVIKDLLHCFNSRHCATKMSCPQPQITCRDY